MTIDVKFDSLGNSTGIEASNKTQLYEEESKENKKASTNITENANAIE